MYRKSLWLYFLSIIALNGLSYASDTEDDKDSLPQIKAITRFEIDANWTVAMIYQNYKCQSNAANAHYVPDFVQDNVPLSVLISIPFKQPEDFATQMSNLIWLGASIDSIDIPSLNSSHRQRAIAECFIQAARITKQKLSSIVGNVNFETAIDDLTSIGQLLMSAAINLDQSYNQDKSILLQQSLDYHNRATDLLSKIDKQQSVVYARKLMEEIAKARHYQQTLGLNQS